MTPNPHLLLLACLALLTPAAPAQHVLLEAEQFADTGGWDVDQQSMDQGARLICWRTAWACPCATR